MKIKILIKKNRLKAIVTCLLLGLFFFMSSGLRFDHSHDEKCLEEFLQYLFIDTLPYVLYGEKPMCLSTYAQVEFFDGYHLKSVSDIGYSIGNAYSPFNQILMKGAYFLDKKLVKKPSNFLLKICNNPFQSSTKVVLIINKANFVKIVEKNKEVFKERLTSFTNVDAFCQKCFVSKEVLLDALEKDEVLLGILLGYGRRNAELYGKRKKLSEELKLMSKEDLQYETMKKELCFVSELLQPFPIEKEDPPFDPNLELASKKEWQHLVLASYAMLCPLPEFVADITSEETEELKKSYQKTREEVRLLYKECPFLEQTLSKIFAN